MVKKTEQGHPSTQKHCDFCDVHYDVKAQLEHEQSVLHLLSLKATYPHTLKETAAQRNLLTYHVENATLQIIDLSYFLDSVKPILFKLINDQLMLLGSIKCNIYVYAEYEKPETNIKQRFSFKTKNIALFRESDLNLKVTNELYSSILKESDDFAMKGSGWTKSQILGLDLKINKFHTTTKPRSYIPFRRSNAIINVQNNDDYCFKYAMLGKFVLGKQKKHKPQTYQGLDDKYNFNCVKFPVTLDAIPVFEKANNVSVNVFHLNDEKPRKYVPIKVADEELPDHTNLLLIEEDGNSHYCYIVNLAKLVCKQVTKHGHKVEMCARCFQHFPSIDALVKHKKSCYKFYQDSPVPSLPEGKDAQLKFKNHSNRIHHDYVVYAKFEACFQPLDAEDKPTYAYQRRVPLTYSYNVISSNPDIRTGEPILYRGKDAHKHFINSMINLGNRVYKFMEKVPKICMSKKDEIHYAEETICYICGREFTEENPKVRDHRHEYVLPKQSNYRGAAHNLCNLSFRHPKSVICFIHKLSECDLHFIVKGLSGSSRNIRIIPSSFETYISLSLKLNNGLVIKFVDSHRFLSESLGKLILTVPDAVFVETKKLFKNKEQGFFVKEKTVFPFDYVSDESVLKIAQPPPRSAFFNKLLNKDVSSEDHERFCKLWYAFECKNLGEYLDIYIKLDVCQLTDTFEEFRRFCEKNWGLDCAHYVSLPGFSFDACLKFSGAEIGLLTDRDMFDMIMSGIRGGICQNIMPYAKANNKYTPDYNCKEPSTFIQHLDVTGLYAHAMCKPLPYGDYKWEHIDSEICDQKSQILQISDDAERGLILDVDLSYPQKFHDLHSDLPFLCERKIPPNPGSKHEKLLLTLEDKQNYVIHYRALKQALEHGLELKKINRAISFEQKPFLRDYIKHNADLRKKASSEFYRDLLKLMNNACYGKLLENPLKWKEIKLCTSTKQILNYISRHNFVDRKIFDEQLVAVQLQKNEVPFNKPIVAGFSVLDISKVHMYKFHYDHILCNYGRDNVSLCYMDTDSFIYLIQTTDRYRDMLDDLELYDTSNFKEDHVCYSIENCKKLGTFKDETKGCTILEYCGLRSKVYAYKAPGIEFKRAKGVQSAVTANFRFEDYKEIVSKNIIMTRSMRSIRSKAHDVYSVITTKVALSNFDDKRQIQEDSSVSLPYGHYKLPGSNIQKKRQLPPTELGGNKRFKPNDKKKAVQRKISDYFVPKPCSVLLKLKPDAGIFQ